MLAGLVAIPPKLAHVRRAVCKLSRVFPFLLNVDICCAGADPGTGPGPGTVRDWGTSTLTRHYSRMYLRKKHLFSCCPPFKQERYQNCKNVSFVAGACGVRACNCRYAVSLMSDCSASFASLNVSFLFHREPDNPTARHKSRRPSSNRRGRVADHLRVSWEWSSRAVEMDWSGCQPRPSTNHPQWTK